MDLTLFEEQIFFSTIRISTSDDSGKGESIGTGFLTQVPVSKERAITYLVSNKHVYDNPKKKITLNFHKSHQQGSKSPDLGKIVTLKADAFDAIYHEHPDPDVDLACINVSAITHPERSIYFRHIPPTMFAKFNEPELLPGKDVWFVGYPENRYDVVHNLPILRRGHIASVPKVDFNGKKHVIIDAQVFPGSSGSPVFCQIGDRFSFIGVVTQTMIKHAQLAAVPAAAAFGVHQTIGLGIVLKATLVQELLDSAEKKTLANIEAKNNQAQIEKGL